ncbi:MAG: hypothetical protein ACE5DN_06215, partial [Flavobacteriales bacterium]
AEFTILPNTKVQLTSQQRGRELLSTSDYYTSELSEFDVQVRLQNIRAKREANYLKFAGKQVREWSEEEIASFRDIVNFTNEQLGKLGITLELPPLIEVVKTSGREEGGAGGYTRGTSIILNKNSVTDFTFVHELCHIMLRYAPELRDTLYSTMGFIKCNKISYPPMIYEQKLTNPDAPVMEHYLRVRYQFETVDVAQFIYSDQPYSSGTLFEYLQIGLLMLKGPPDNKQAIYDDNNDPRILAYDDVQTLYEQIGKNTGYNIHPEELTASHFTIMMFEKTNNLDKPELITRMHDILAGWKKK